MKPLKQKAARLVKRVSAIGKSKQQAPHQIRSVGTLRDYQQCIRQYLQWRDNRNLPAHTQSSERELLDYLEEMSEWVAQKTLDQHRMALARVFNKKLKKIVARRLTELKTRTFQVWEVMEVAQTLPDHYAIPVLLGFFAGLRSHEIYTLQREDEMNRSERRKWRPDLFLFLEDYLIYVVTGKGGLVRHVAIPKKLAELLERHRLQSPKTILDRGIFYSTFYNLAGGQKLSQQFSKKCKQILGFHHNKGFHGLRHTYVQNRIRTLIKNGISFDVARAIVSQELGHFRPEITNTYLR